MADFFQINRSIVYFVYGGAFFVLGLAIAIRSRKHSELAGARHLWLLATFGVVHGIYEWGSVFIPIQAAYVSANAVNALLILQFIVEVVSFLALFQFGVELVASSTRKRSWRFVPLVMLGLWAVAVIWLYFVTVESLKEFLDVGDAMSRFLLGVPGAITAAWGFRQQAHQVDHLHFPGIANYFRGTALAFAVYAVLTAVVPRGDYFPASFLNYDNLMSIGIPAPLFRAACGIVIAVLIIRGLEIFDIETDHLIEEAAQAHAISADRERIGRELHDSIIQSLHATGLMLEDAQVTLEQDPEYAQRRLAEVSRVLNRTIYDIRAYVLDLHRDFEMGDWRTGLGEMVRTFRLQTLTDAEFIVAGVPEWEPPPKEWQEILGITREALTNVQRHSHATRVRVVLTFKPHEVKLEIVDNGVGFVAPPVGESSPNGEHRGLANMRGRANLINAKLSIDSTPAHGTNVQLTLTNHAGPKGKTDDA
jgi:signal transduction histidine kinase